MRKFLGFKVFLIVLLSALINMFIIGMTLMYGPWNGFRDLYISSAIDTLNHKHLAEWFFSEDVIKRAKANNSFDFFESVTDTEAIQTNPHLEKNEVTLTEISKNGYNAWMLEISDPSKVMLGVTKYFGTKGQKMPFLLQNYDAIAGINAGGFGDRDGFGDGGIAIGLVISEGEILHMPDKYYYDVVGFNEDDVLVVGRYKKSEIAGLNLRDAVEFTPCLVMNGEPAVMKGNGGLGLAPRTAIGQRKDGTVVFVVVDGRSAASVGATIKELRDIMIEQGCYNAANLDGGSSTVLSYKDRIINNPSGSDRDGMRFIPNAFIVLNDEE